MKIDLKDFPNFPYSQIHEAWKKSFESELREKYRQADMYNVYIIKDLIEEILGEEK